MVDQILGGIRNALQQQANAGLAAKARRFFKEPIDCYGVAAPELKEIAKNCYPALKLVTKDEVFLVCTHLFESGKHEEGILAGIFAARISKHSMLQDFIMFEQWIKNNITNWAVCDGFCNNTVGAFLERYPEYVEQLFSWTTSDNRWVRRAAAVSLILPARKGLFLPQIFDIAIMLLKDNDDMVQKGYGWLLKVASAQHLDEVFNFVLQHKDNMPRTALRYAIEKMPDTYRQKAMVR